MLRAATLTLLGLLFFNFYALASSIDFVKLEARSSEKVIHFKWSVNSEEGGDYFVIEKSTDENEWEQVSKVSSIGDHNDPHVYMISQINQVEGVKEFFRIQRVDKEGSLTLMDEVQIAYKPLVNLYLIPAVKIKKEDLFVSFSSRVVSDGTITITDESGTVLVTQKISIEFGYNRIAINTRSFNKGNYDVTVSDTGKSVIKKAFEHGAKAKSKF